MASLNFKERIISNKSGPDGPSGPELVSARKQTPAYDSPEWRAIWLRSLEAACAEWRAIPYNDLAISGGDPRRLTRLVNMHYDLADGEAWRQVEAFLGECRRLA